MIAEKPIWIKHEGMQIFSIDVQPGGLRFATGGGDHKVRIWSTKYIGKDDLEIQDSASQLLATLRDHFGSVNCVRWAKHGRLIASGSDDQVIQVHEKKPGSGTAEFGSGEAPDVENWKVAMTLRGHTADVVDINWSPDNLILASGSLDNTIHIWDMSTGLCTAVLRGHSSLVKGVTWDPIGSFIASQSDDKTVIIWRTSDWSLAHRTDGHWAKSLGSTFFRRLGWSPCGHFITTTHGFQKPRHSAPVLERGEWSATFDFLGHNAPIIVVKFNNSMFRRFPSNNNNSNNNGTSKKESQPYNVIAIGSQDRTITLWTTASARPLFVAKHFFSQSVVDLSWSPDGYSLYACSLDGTIAAFHFKVTELGQRLTDAELDDLKKSRYGDTRGRLTNLAESPAQLLLEAAATKQTIAKKPTIIDVLQNPISFKSTTKPPLPPQNVQDGKKVFSGPICENLNKLPPTASQKTPVKQREIRAPDGRRRITPETIGVVGNQLENITDLVQNQNFIMNPLDKSCDMEVSVKKTIGVTARASVVESLVIEKIPESSRRDGGLTVEQIGRTGSTVANVISIRVFDKYNNEIPICLEARPREEAVTDYFGGGILKDETEISCIRGNQTIWSDRITGKVTVLAGNSNFWAAGCEDGCLQIYTKCGRRAMPTMMMGSSAIFIDCDELWKLLVVTKKGLLYVWDLFSRKCLLRDSLSSLVTPDPKTNGGKIKVVSAKLSKSGCPLIVLATRHAYIYDINLKCWLKVLDDTYSCSSFASSLTFNPARCGELAGLQVDANKCLSGKPSLTRSSDDGVQTRAHLEAQLASSLALSSASEYRNSLVLYVRYLTREADESRLREVCESFIGPPTGMGEANHPSWDSSVLGMKKHKLLKDDILPAMASNRKVQRLLNEFLDILSENQTSNELTESTNLTDPQHKITRKLMQADQENSNPKEKHEMNSNPKPADNIQAE